MKKFYITTTLPYVNAPPHIGFALEIIQADVIARSKRAQGYEVVFNTGTDEHGVKIYRKALEEGKDPQQYVDEYAKKFDALKSALNVSYTSFIRTTDLHHVSAAQEFWKRCEENGDIEKKAYRVKYCVGCELEKTDSELIDGKCAIHTYEKLEEIEEENYFFKFSRYEKRLLELYESRPDFVVPDFRLNEIKKFVESGLTDFSVSRLKEKMPWGVPVPGDPSHVMYVWFDALINYISTLGWPENEENFSSFWPGVQVAGKDNLRQQSAMWQAMLFSAGLPPSRQIFIHGFIITSSGQKMSKSFGNVINPLELAGKYGTDAVRYYLLREIPAYDDGNFDEDKFRERYNSDLANGLGNFAARVLALAECDANIRMHANDTNNANKLLDKEVEDKIKETRDSVNKKLDAYKFHEALALIWGLISFGDLYVNEKKPWAIKNVKTKERVIFNLLVLLDNVSALVFPFMPDASEKITNCIVWEGRNTLKAKKITQLFPRILAK